MIDYRALLLKYIAHVGQEEGETYIDRLEGADYYPQFSQEEVAELLKLDKETLP